MNVANTRGMIWSLLCDILIFLSFKFVENWHDMSFCHVTVNMLKENINIYFYFPTLWIIFTPISVWMSPATRLHPLVDCNERHFWSLKASINKENKKPIQLTKSSPVSHHKVATLRHSWSHAYITQEFSHVVPLALQLSWQTLKVAVRLA